MVNTLLNGLNIVLLKLIALEDFSHIVKFQIQYFINTSFTILLLNSKVLGKVEGDKDDNNKKNWHGHVTAITVAPDSRRQGIARFLMDYLEQVTEKHDGWFVDLFVRPSNKIAVGMYRALGYDVYQTVNKYYSSQHGKTEDAYDMRKSMKKDVDKVTMKPTGKRIQPEDLEFH